MELEADRQLLASYPAHVWLNFFVYIFLINHPVTAVITPQSYCGHFYLHFNPQENPEL